MFTTSCIAIVTTIYNDYSIVKKLFDSLLKQTDSNFVHYIYDDGSSVFDSRVVDQYISKVGLLKNKYKVVFVRGEKNLGVNKAHEVVFRMVKEDYFVWVDADDWLNKNFVRIIRKFINKHKDIDVFHVNSKRFNERYQKAKYTSSAILSKSAKKDTDQFPYYCLDGERFFHNFVVKKETLLFVNQELFIYDINKSKPFWYDAQILFELAITHKKFLLIKKPLSNIVEREDSVSRKINVSVYNDCEEIPSILNRINICKNDKELFYNLLPFSKHRVALLELINNDKITEYKIINKNDKEFLKQNGYPRNYLLLDSYYKFLVLRKRLIFFVKIRRKLIVFINILFRKNK